MKNYYLNTSMAAAALITLAACSVRDHITEIIEPSETKGAIVVKPNWDNCNVNPETFYVKVSDCYLDTHSGGECNLGQQFEAGTHYIYVYNTVSNIPVSGTVATVAAYADNTRATTLPVIQSAAGWFSNGKEVVTVEAEQTHQVTVAAKQRVREVTLTVTPDGDMAEYVKAITGYLTGIAGSYDMESNTYGSASKVPLFFVKTTDGKWQATVHIMGIVGDEQLLKTYVWYDEPNTPGGPTYPTDPENPTADPTDPENPALPQPGEPVEPEQGEENPALPEQPNPDPDNESSGIPPVEIGTDDPTAPEEEKIIIDLGGEDDFNNEENTDPVEIGGGESGGENAITIPSDPVKGSIRVEAEGIDTALQYSVEAREENGAELLHSQEVTGASNLLNYEFYAGKYTIFASYKSNSIGRDGFNYTVAGENGYIVANDIALRTGTANVTVNTEGEHTANVTMRNHVREVLFVLEPTGDAAARIATISSTITNVAGSYNVDTDTYSNAASVKLSFTKGDGGKWRATAYLLGIMPNGNHNFSATVTYTGGNPSESTVPATDLTTDLGDFNARKDETLTLTATLETTASGDFNATIKDWEAGTGGGAIAN